MAFFIGPLFCGWICPAGQFTEFMSRLVPDRVKINLSGKLNPTPIRYGVLAGVMIAPFFGSNLSCTFCNFFMMQNMISAAFGKYHMMLHWTSFTFATFVLWFIVLGLFTKGGRGWCNFLCPAGALMNLSHSVGSRFRSGYAVRVDAQSCENCTTCNSVCPAWAISSQSKPKINLHVCNGCMDCIHACPNNAIDYRRVSTGSTQAVPQ